MSLSISESISSTQTDICNIALGVPFESLLPSKLLLHKKKELFRCNNDTDILKNHSGN